MLQQHAWSNRREDMRAATMFAVVLMMMVVLVGCMSNEITVKPIKVTIDVNVKLMDGTKGQIVKKLLDEMENEKRRTAVAVALSYE
jgi:translation initiation factor 2 alpha subunit (eIF-2alpha)